MDKHFNWLRYFSPLVGIVFCPVTILFLWAIWTGPIEGEVKAPLSEIKN
tara:strand:- start:755 stop:901 length:147 start_codon:yes stop_codon:yes gene_type:complete